MSPLFLSSQINANSAFNSLLSVLPFAFLGIGSSRTTIRTGWQCLGSVLETRAISSASVTFPWYSGLVTTTALEYEG